MASIPCRPRMTTTGIILLAGLLLADPARAQPCPLPPLPVKDLNVPRFYLMRPAPSSTRSCRTNTRKPSLRSTCFCVRSRQDADKALRRTNPKSQVELAVCALAWLTDWAKGEAWLGVMATRQAEYQRKWDLAGVALSYLKLQRFATADERAVIEPWLIKWADTARAFFNDPERKRNNHWYWLGLGQAAVGVATNSPRHWELARGIMRDATADIRADGTLPRKWNACRAPSTTTCSRRCRWC